MPGNCTGLGFATTPIAPVRRAYADADRESTNAYKHIKASDAGQFTAARAGDLCTVSGPEYPLDYGSPGHLRQINGKLVCVPDRRQDAAADARAEARLNDENSKMRGAVQQIVCYAAAAGKRTSCCGNAATSIRCCG